MTREELVAEVTARHQVRESKMFGMSALAAGAEPFDPGMGRLMEECVLVPADRSATWKRLVEQAIG